MCHPGGAGHAGTLPAPEDTPTGAPTVRRDTLPEDVLSVVPATEDKTRSETVVVLLKSSKTGLPEHVAEHVIGKFWSALRALVAGHLSILGPGVLRALRMLAVFTCPAPESHREVHEHTVVPLMNDARGIISDEVKTRVIALLPKLWRRGPIPNEA
ncbi:hypothetical protein [Rugosimonospora africana]|uniref:Uncharacterized protein n=1 Tax=Rugosimonospora africana TaxID=556532 RepID=A0A8J3VUN2_9ACTN|nr:hypothetical protein [Rugosimonospora africana]GIH18911.1 hypothetical protein Raf01_70830 [Rugosimonospora africana]